MIIDYMMVTLLEGVLALYSQGEAVFKCEGEHPLGGVDKTLHTQLKDLY